MESNVEDSRGPYSHVFYEHSWEVRDRDGNLVEVVDCTEGNQLEPGWTWRLFQQYPVSDNDSED